MFNSPDPQDDADASEAFVERQPSMVETITDDALDALKILSGGIASIMVNSHTV